MTHIQRCPPWSLAALLLASLSTSALGQTVPDAGSLLKEQERQRPQLPKPAPQAVPQAPTQINKSDLRVTVKAFKITGNSLIAEPDLQTVLAPWIGQESGYAELQEALNAISEAYRKRGWFARPQLPAQDITEGIISINIIEGKLGAVHIDDQGKHLRISKDFVGESVTARQRPGDPLNLDDLERSNSLLNDTPGVAVTTVLAPGKEAGESDAIVKVQDKPLITAIVQADNQGARSTGENKLTANGTLDNPFGIGDQIQLNTNASQGSEYAKLGYSLPVGRDGLRMGVSTSHMQYRLIGDLASLKSKGDAQTYGVNGTYPLLRSGTQNINLAAAYDRKNYYNEANAITTSDKVLDVVILGVSGDQLDGFGAGGMTLWSLNLTGGNVDLSATATNEKADRIGPQSAGNYHKLSYSLARLQRLTDKATLWLSFNGQAAGKNLDSSEKMSLGGPFGVRAYPVIEGTGDDGWLTTLEARYNILPALQVSAFYDQGWVRQSHDANYTGSPLVNTGTLKGAGLAVGWTQAGNFSLKAVWAHRIGDNPFANPLNGKDQDGSLDKNRLWLTAVMFF
ncbi:MAG: ShlB/FhaC/HecB family hemolysin secretion/activation protein [Betaproteobacteria bacterium HGW-Betaproteobacteria-10]|nr:MAG: ShlB/FhaC/HecB family hemolysin secretion/activation protein [Betaproteobacteria bacterium HGW-Betaproteobacteria-10]